MNYSKHNLQPVSFHVSFPPTYVDEGEHVRAAAKGDEPPRWFHLVLKAVKLFTAQRRRRVDCVHQIVCLYSECRHKKWFFFTFSQVRLFTTLRPRLWAAAAALYTQSADFLLCVVIIIMATRGCCLLGNTNTGHNKLLSVELCWLGSTRFDLLSGSGQYWQRIKANNNMFTLR